MTVLVRIEHCIGSDGLRYCAWGLRTFCARHGIDPRRLRMGIPVDEVDRIDDDLAREVARRAREAAAEVAE